MNKKNIKQLIDEVIDMVKDVPEAYRKNSFEVLMNYRLTHDIAVQQNTKSKKHVSTKIKKHNDLEIILNAEYDWASTRIKSQKGITQYLRILSITKNDFNIDTLSSSDISEILKHKFRENKTSNAISMSLMESLGNYVDRIKVERGFQYRVTPSGESYLNEIFGGKKD